MVEEPDRIRQEIEATRAELARDVDQLADRTSPARVANRKWHDVKAKVRGVSDRVMGSSSDAAHSVQGSAYSAKETVADKASSAKEAVQDKAQQLQQSAKEGMSTAADAVRQAPQTVTRKTQGNPLAAGLIAFGAGMLAASLLPETEFERRAGQKVKDQAGDLVEPLKDKAAELREDLSGTVQEATQQIKETARDAAQTTKEQAKGSAQEAAAQTRDTTRAATSS